MIANVDAKQEIADNSAVYRTACNVSVNFGMSKANRTESNCDAVNQDNCLSVGITGTCEDCRVTLEDADVDLTKEGLRAAQEQDDDISPILICKEPTSDGPERGELMSYGLTIRQYIQRWDDLSIIEGVLYRTLRSRNGLRTYHQLITPRSHQQTLIRMIHEQGHFGLKRTCEQLQRRAYWVSWKKRLKQN